MSRLGAALDQLEAAAARRAQAEGARGNLEDELNVMQDDRARLALDLDGALARGRALASANAEVMRRLETVEDTVKALLAGVDPDRPSETA